MTAFATVTRSHSACGEYTSRRWPDRARLISLTCRNAVIRRRLHWTCDACRRASRCDRQNGLDGDRRLAAHRTAQNSLRCAEARRGGIDRRGSARHPFFMHDLIRPVVEPIAARAIASGRLTQATARIHRVGRRQWTAQARSSRRVLPMSPAAFLRADAAANAVSPIDDVTGLARACTVVLRRHRRRSAPTRRMRVIGRTVRSFAHTPPRPAGRDVATIRAGQRN